MAKLYKPFSVTGVANDTAWDAGLISTEAEAKHLIALILFVTGHAGNRILGDLELERYLELYDYHIDTDESSGSTNVQRSTTKINRVEVGVNIKIGRTFKVGIQCGATNKNLIGAYEYEVK